MNKYLPESESEKNFAQQMSALEKQLKESNAVKEVEKAAATKAAKKPEEGKLSQTASLNIAEESLEE